MHKFQGRKQTSQREGQAAIETTNGPSSQTTFANQLHRRHNIVDSSCDLSVLTIYDTATQTLTQQEHTMKKSTTSTAYDEVYANLPDHLAFTNHQPSPAYQAPMYQSAINEVNCPYHMAVLQMRNAGEKNYVADPMARWEAEDYSKQSSIVQLDVGQLSVHRES
jgi:hypothetical protein